VRTLQAPLQNDNTNYTTASGQAGKPVEPSPAQVVTTNTTATTSTTLLSSSTLQSFRKMCISGQGAPGPEPFPCRLVNNRTDQLRKSGGALPKK
jgi:hypothetical protein